MRLPIDQESPDSADPMVNTAREISHNRLAPKRSVAQPETGTASARVRR